VTLAVSLFLIASLAQVDHPYTSARQHLVKGLYREGNIDTYLQVVEKRYVPDNLKQYGWTVPILKAATEQRVEIKWTW
jgi:hypothetical protein